MYVRLFQLFANRGREQIMKMLLKIALTLFVLLTISLVHADRPAAVHRVVGQAVWIQDTGPDSFPNHEPYLTSTAINAWLDGDGVARGTIVWPGTSNGPNDQDGPGFSGYPWQIGVDTFVMLADNAVYLGGVIVHSQVPPDEGTRVD